MQQSTTSATLAPTLPRRTLRTSVRFGLVVLLALIAGAGYLLFRMAYVPNNLDTSATRLTANGLYRIGYTPAQTPPPLHQMQSWTLQINTADGAPVEGAQVTVDGGMPQHGHGLPTRPQVTADLGSGAYRVEGLKFHMPGWWVLDVTVTADGRTDQVRFNLILQ